MRTLLIGAGLAALLSGAASAQDAPPLPPSPPPGASVPPPPPPPLTRDRVAADAERAFARIDADKDGVVTRAEYDTARKTMEDRRRARRDRAFDRMDRDGNGAVSRPEFAAPPPPPAGADGKPPLPPGRHRGRGPGPMADIPAPDWFGRADANGDGKVTAAEAQAAALARFDALDRNHDGTLDRSEMPAPPPPVGPGGDLPPPRRD